MHVGRGVRGGENPRLMRPFITSDPHEPEPELAHDLLFARGIEQVASRRQR